MTTVCRACGQPRPADHDYCFACGARLGLVVLPSNQKRFRFSGIGISAPRIIGRSDRLGEQQRRHTPGTWIARRWAELSLLGLLLWAFGGQPWVPVSIQLPAISIKPDSWLARALPAVSLANQVTRT